MKFKTLTESIIVSNIVYNCASPSSSCRGHASPALYACLHGPAYWHLSPDSSTQLAGKRVDCAARIDQSLSSSWCAGSGDMSPQSQTPTR